MGENGNCSTDIHVDEDGEMTSYKKDAVSVVHFKIIYGEGDLKSKKTYHFKPDMAHQIFGESESIFGYRSLSIYLYYLHNSARCYVDIQKSGETKRDLNKPDDIMKCLNQWLPENFTTDVNEFKKMVENENHSLMFGTVLNEWQDEQECKLFPIKNIYPNYKVTLCDIADENFKDFHRRFETYIVWFIDAANFIDLEDERWMIFYVYEEFQHPDTKEMYRSPVGYCSLYKFYAYPDKIRARISQFFVLPSHQRRGIGSKLYQTVMKKINDMPEVIDLTVEEPTSTFQKIRDLYDSLTVSKDLVDSKIHISTGSQKKIFQRMKKHKICKRQCQRIYDILNCCDAYKSNPTLYQKCIDSIKNRIAADIEADTRVSKKVCIIEGVPVSAEPADKTTLIETEFKRYIDDIEPSIKYIQKRLVART